MLLRSVAKLGNAMQRIQCGGRWPVLNARAKFVIQEKNYSSSQTSFENVEGPFGDDRLKDGDGEVEDASRRKEEGGSGLGSASGPFGSFLRGPPSLHPRSQVQPSVHRTTHTDNYRKNCLRLGKH